MICCASLHVDDIEKKKCIINYKGIAISRKYLQKEYYIFRGNIILRKAEYTVKIPHMPSILACVFKGARNPRWNEGLFPLFIFFFQ